MRVGLLLKRNQPAATEIARELCGWMQKRGLEAWVVGDGVGPTSGGGLPTGSLEGGRGIAEGELVERIDLLVVLGGDGTLLHGAELVADRGVPILGVNLGHLGFLTTCPPERARDTLSLALDGKLEIEQRMRLRVVVTRSDQPRLLARKAGAPLLQKL